MFEYIQFDKIDYILLSFVLILSCIISYFDIKSRQFPFILWLFLTIIGIIWCFKQDFIPLTFIPIGVGMSILSLYNHFIKKVIGIGDILLFLTTSFFIPLSELSLFMIICGISGFLTYGIMKINRINNDRLPFSGAILFSMILTFCLYLV